MSLELVEKTKKHATGTMARDMPARVAPSMGRKSAVRRLRLNGIEGRQMGRTRRQAGAVWGKDYRLQGHGLDVICNITVRDSGGRGQRRVQADAEAEMMEMEMEMDSDGTVCNSSPVAYLV